MKIREIKTRYIGPFYESITLELDDRVTIITGPNDVGKSSILRVAELLFSNTALTEDFVNHDYIQELKAAWSSDANLMATAMISVTDRTDFTGISDNFRIHESDKHYYIQRLTGELKKTAIQHTESKVHGQLQNLQINRPVVIFPQRHGESVIRSEIDLSQPNPLERALLSTAFGATFNNNILQSLKSIQFTRSIRDAQENLNKILQNTFPHPGLLRFELMPVEGSRQRLAILVRDRHDGITPFGHRGAGVRRMITLMAELITMAKDAHHRLVWARSRMGVNDQPDTHSRVY